MNFIRESRYSERLSRFFQSLQANVGIVPQLGYDCFLPKSFQFVIIQFSSYCLKLYSLEIESVVRKSMKWKIRKKLWLSQESSDDIGMDNGLDSRSSISGRARDFSLLHRVQVGSGPSQPPLQWVAGVLPPRVKRPGREAGYSPSYSAEVKNSGAIPPIPNKYSWLSL
jgi:hypothetical protein